MAEKNDGGDKTEKPTEKRLKDARKKGDVAKSKDTTATLVLIVWTVLAVMLWRTVLDRLTAPFEVAFQALGAPSVPAYEAVASAAAKTVLILTMMFYVPVAATGLLVEFVQAGPVLQTEKMKPKLDHMNPGEGLKRMFSVDNLVEVAKSLAKTLLLVLICWIVLQAKLPDLLQLAGGDPGEALAALGHVTLMVLGGAAAVFLLVSAVDAAYQKFSFTKKMRMSRRDMRQEAKDMEGDPHIKSRRRQIHQEWANRNSVEAARNAAVLVVNPTHIAVALDYDPEEHPAPVVAAMGEGALAARMREAAEAAGVPVIRNVDVARALHQRAVLDDIIPPDMFAAVAEIILWARKMRAEAQEAGGEGPTDSPPDSPPGPALLRLPPPEAAR